MMVLWLLAGETTPLRVIAETAQNGSKAWISRNRHSPSAPGARGRHQKHDLSKKYTSDDTSNGISRGPMQRSIVFEGKKIEDFFDFSKKNCLPVPQGPLGYPWEAPKTRFIEKVHFGRHIQWHFSRSHATEHRFRGKKNRGFF